MKTTFVRVLILFVGLIIAHFGVSLFLLANLGSDPFNVMIQGLSRTMAVRVISNVLGCVILALGMSVVIKSDAGTGPNDLVGVVISDKLKKKFSIVRMIVDACFLICGWLLGGVVGIGTVICLFLVGPVAGFFLPRSGKIIGKIVS